MKRILQVSISLAVIICLIFIPSGEVLAQDPPLNIFFNPDPSYLYTSPSNTTVVNVDINNAVNIWSFDVVFVYDQNVATITNYEIVDIFDGIYCIHQVNDPGYFALGCTSWGGSPFDGATTVVKLTFQGTAVGQTPLTFTNLTTFSNQSFVKVPIARHHGVLNVIDPTNFQYLPLIMNVSAQGQVNRGGFGVALGPGLNYGKSYSGSSLNQAGNNLTFPSVVADAYRITTNHARVLNITEDLDKTFTPATGANTVPALRLAAGNAVWTDNVIDVHDLTAVNGAYGDASLNEDADVNFDGAVDGRDLALVAGNFGLTSSVAYAGWLP